MSKTASDLRREGWPVDKIEKYRPWLAAERYSKDRKLKKRRDRAMAISRKAARLLREIYGAERVVLFGSLAHDAWYTPRSDIDLYAEGIAPDQFFKAEKDIQEMGEGFKVDLVESKECSPELLRKIERDGIEI